MGPGECQKEATKEETVHTGKPTAILIKHLSRVVTRSAIVERKDRQQTSNKTSKKGRRLSLASNGN